MRLRKEIKDASKKSADISKKIKQAHIDIADYIS